MVDAIFFLPQKKRKVKLDKVREGLRPITLRFRANARKLILGSIGTLLDHLRVNNLPFQALIFNLIFYFILFYSLILSLQEFDSRILSGKSGKN